MKNGNYEYCKELARQVLSDYGVTELPVDVHNLYRQQKITVLYDDEAAGWDGIAAIKCRQPYILLRRGLSLARERYVIAHELGHLWLGHVGAWGNTVDRSETIKQVREREATEFAMELLMPLYALSVLRANTAEEIQNWCGVNYPLAVYRQKQIARNKKVVAFLVVFAYNTSV